MAHTFESTYAITEEVWFSPMARHQRELCISEEEIEGIIMAVRFTEAKVFYDVYNNYWGKLFEGVSSERISPVVKVNLEA